MKLLNLGCGSKTSAAEGVVNVDWSIYLRVRKNPVLRLLVPVVFRGERLERYRKLPDNIIVQNLSKGLLFEPDSVDAVYHSHMLEHLDKNVAEQFMREVRRVLKPGGIQRIVVPDFEKLCRTYLDDVMHCESHPEDAANHEQYISEIIEQMVRREASGTSRQRPFRRYIEGILLGDARHRGETHQWMYDRFSLKSLLARAEFNSIKTIGYDESEIPNWHSMGLDCDESGKEYKPGSLYVEAKK